MRDEEKTAVFDYKRIPLGPLWTNSYTFDDGNGTAFCVDPGGDPADVVEFLQNRRLKLGAILLTHGHMDHCLGVADLVEATGAPVYMARGDLNMTKDNWANLAVEFGREVPPYEPSKLLDEGDTFSVGRFSLTVLLTPGHTPGSCCYIVEKDGEKLLISGDTLFARSIGRSDLRGGDSEALARSLARLKELKGDLPVLPGHGPETSLDRERQLNPFLQ